MRKCPRKGSIVIEKSTGVPMEVAAPKGKRACAGGVVHVTPLGGDGMETASLADLRAASRGEANAAKAAAKHGFLCAQKSTAPEGSWVKEFEEYHSKPREALVPAPAAPGSWVAEFEEYHRKHAPGQLAPSAESMSQMYGLKGPGSRAAVHHADRDDSLRASNGLFAMAERAMDGDDCRRAESSITDAIFAFGAASAHNSAAGDDPEELSLNVVRAAYRAATNRFLQKCVR